MPEIQIAPEVAGRLGEEQVRRIMSGQALRVAQCWECAEVVDVDVDPAAVVILLPEPSGGADSLIQHVTMTHQRCRQSQVRVLTNAEADAKRAEHGHRTEPHEFAAQVYAQAVILPMANDQGRPLLFLSFQDALTLSAASDRVDLYAEHFLTLGWQLVTKLGKPPEWLDGWTVHYQMDRAASTSSGTLVVTDPAGQPIGEFERFQPGTLWLPGILQTGSCSVYVAPLDLRELNWTDFAGAQRVARAGMMVGVQAVAKVYQPAGKPATRT